MTVTLMNTSGKKLGLDSLVDMNSLKLWSYSISLSPNLINVLLLVIVNYFNSNGSNDGSNTSFISSISSGIPDLIQFSKFFNNPS